MRREDAPYLLAAGHFLSALWMNSSAFRRHLMKGRV